MHLYSGACYFSILSYISTILTCKLLYLNLEIYNFILTNSISFFHAISFSSILLTEINLKLMLMVSFWWCICFGTTSASKRPLFHASFSCCCILFLLEQRFSPQHCGCLRLNFARTLLVLDHINFQYPWLYHHVKNVIHVFFYYSNIRAHIVFILV